MLIFNKLRILQILDDLEFASGPLIPLAVHPLVLGIARRLGK